jgi:hypothetical protein
VEALAALHLIALLGLLLLAPSVNLSGDVAALELQARELLVVIPSPRLAVIVAYLAAVRSAGRRIVPYQMPAHNLGVFLRDWRATSAVERAIVASGRRLLGW